MKVIALVGAKNTGKSHTINMVYTFLLRDGFEQTPCHFRVLGNPQFEDFIDILEKDGEKVGFVGMGDYISGPGRSLHSLLKELGEKDCDVVFCASRNNPKIIAAVTAYPSHIIVSKNISSGKENDRIVNANDALNMIAQM